LFYAKQNNNTTVENDAPRTSCDGAAEGSDGGTGRQNAGPATKSRSSSLSNILNEEGPNTGRKQPVHAASFHELSHPGAIRNFH